MRQGKELPLYITMSLLRIVTCQQPAPNACIKYRTQRRVFIPSWNLKFFHQSSIINKSLNQLSDNRLIGELFTQDAVARLGQLQTSVAFPAFSVADGACLKIAKVGHYATFKVQAKDRFANKLQAGANKTQFILLYA